MRGVIIIKGDEDYRKVRNPKAHIEMRLSGWFDKLEYKNVNDSIGTEVMCVRTNRKTFESLKEQLNCFYPNRCVFIEKTGLI